MNIGIIGANPLGVAFSLICENVGYDVIIYDEDEDVIFNLNQDIYNTTEPLIQKMLFEVHNFSATTDNVEVIKECDLIFTFVATPSTMDGNYDTSKVFEVANDFLQCLN